MTSGTAGRGQGEGRVESGARETAPLECLPPPRHNAQSQQRRRPAGPARLRLQTASGDWEAGAPHTASSQTVPTAGQSRPTLTDAGVSDLGAPLAAVADRPPAAEADR